MGAKVFKHTGMLTPRNVNDVLNYANTPARPLLLKVDIDSYDVDVALAVLHHRSPDFIFVEINEKIPPPVCYCLATAIAIGTTANGSGSITTHTAARCRALCLRLRRIRTGSSRSS